MRSKRSTSPAIASACLCGSDPNRPLMDFLARKQANVRVVAPYVYADEAEEPQVLAFIDALVDGELDGLAFTSSPQVRRLLKVARGQGREAELIAARERALPRRAARWWPSAAARRRDRRHAALRASYFIGNPWYPPWSSTSRPRPIDNHSAG